MGWDLISELRQLSHDLTAKRLDDAVKAKHPAILDAAAKRIGDLTRDNERLQQELKSQRDHYHAVTETQ